MTTLRAALHECMTEALEKGRPEVDHIITVARGRFGDMFRENGEHLAWQAARRLVKSMLRELAESSQQQMALPGLQLPGAIAVRRDDGVVYYVRADKATWHEIVAGRKERVQHVSAAEARLKDYDEAMTVLQPIMEDDPDITVVEAVRRLTKERATAA